jgi:antirestriction protein ArdC
MEELVAELGAAYLSSEFLVPNAPRPDHAAYLEHWLRVLRSDKRAIFTASSMANEAVSWLMSI